VSINSAAAEEIRRSGGGVVVSPNSPASLLEGITGLARDIDTSTVLGLAGRRYARGALDARAGLKRYQDFVDLAVGRPATPEITVAVR
jgi:hypothetical protein